MADRLCGKTPLRQGDCGLFAVEWPRRTGRPLPRPPAQEAWSMSQEPWHTENQRIARTRVFLLLGLTEMKASLRASAKACPVPLALAAGQPGLPASSLEQALSSNQEPLGCRRRWPFPGDRPVLIIPSGCCSSIASRCQAARWMSSIIAISAASLLHDLIT